MDNGGSVLVLFRVFLNFLSVHEIKIFFSKGVLPPMKPFDISDRWVTAAITGIQTMEMLKTLEEILIDFNEFSTSGVFVHLFTRMLTTLIIG